MGKETCITVDGTVIEALRDANFRVELENSHILLCTISGKLRRSYVKIIQGDEVKLEMSPYDLNRGRIVFRYNNSNNNDNQSNNQKKNTNQKKRK
jgi:translation initiation factor IF-1